MNERILHPELTDFHIVDIQTRFADYDMFGHVNNNSYLAFFDIGKTQFFNDIFEKNCTPTDLSAAIVNINIDFLSPAVAGEPLRVLSAVTNLGDHSFTVYQRVVNALTGDIKAQCTGVLAGFDIATQSSAPLSPELKAKLAKIALPR